MRGTRLPATILGMGGAMLALAAPALARPRVIPAPPHRPALHRFLGRPGPSPWPVRPQIGAPGLGDPFFPLAGNGGYDVLHYGLRLAYDPATGILDGSADIAAVATSDLSRFDLDLSGFTVGAVSVDGRPASFTRDGQELQITPARPLRRGLPLLVSVSYSGAPAPIIDPDGSIEG